MEIPKTNLHLRPKLVLVFFALLAVSLGVFLRFYKIDHRLFWEDEVLVVCRLSGHTESELGREIKVGQVHSFEDFDKYLHPAKYSRGILGVVKAVREQPHIPPLYESLLWYWVQLFGDSITAIRSFSVFLSLFAFPLVIWLCWELFRSYKVGWIAAILIAVSPYQLAYAREARNYSIWCVATLFSSAALLRAVRVNSLGDWTLYAGSLAFGLYSHVFFYLVLTAHAVYVLLFERGLIKKAAFSVFVALALFSPQLYLIIRSFNRISSIQQWVLEPVPFERLALMFSKGVTILFFEFKMPIELSNKWGLKGLAAPLDNLLPHAVVAGVTLLLSYFWKKAPRKAAAFALLIFAVNFLSLLIPDLLWGGFRTGVVRYLMAAFLMIQVGTAFVLYFLAFSEKKVLRTVAYFFLIILFLIGSVSCFWRSGQSTGFFSFDEGIYREAAAFLDDHKGSLLIQAERSFNFMKPLIVPYYLKSRDTSYFMRISKSAPFPDDLPQFNRCLFAWPQKQASDEEIKRWVEASGKYTILPVGPPHWRLRSERIYEIKKV